jgi:hydrogenase-4 component B
MLAVSSLLFTVITFLLLSAVVAAVYDNRCQRRIKTDAATPDNSARTIDAEFDHSLPSTALFVCGLAMFAAAVSGWLHEVSWNLPWPITMIWAPASCKIDALAAIFIGVFGITLCAVALCATRSLHVHAGELNAARHWIGIFLFACGTLCVTLASNAPTFVYAWLIVLLSLTFLFRVAEPQSQTGRSSLSVLNMGFISLVEIAIASGWMASANQTPDFSDWAFADHHSLAPAMLFFLGLISIAGFWPFHDRFIQAQRSMPVTVSVLLNAVLAPTAVYSIIRLLILHNLTSRTLGYLFLFIALFAALWCSLTAVLQQSLKGVSLYVSLQSAALSVAGLAFTLIGRAVHLPVVSALGLSAALCFSLTSSLSSPLLFFAADIFLRNENEPQFQFRAQSKHLPWTGFAFLVGAAAMAGLPTLSGFNSRWLLFHAAFQSASTGESIPLAASMLVVLAVLGLVSGLTIWSLAKPLTMAFSSADSTAMAGDKDAPLVMRLAILVLAAISFGLGLFGTPTILLLRPVCYAAKCGGLTSFPIPVGVFGCAIAILTCFVYFLEEDKPATASAETAGDENANASADVETPSEVHSIELEQPGRSSVRQFCAAMMRLSSSLQECSVGCYCGFVLLVMAVILLVGVFA